jgi:hypothetical protein
MKQNIRIIRENDQQIQVNERVEKTAHRIGAGFYRTGDFCRKTNVGNRITKTWPRSVENHISAFVAQESRHWSTFIAARAIRLLRSKTVLARSIRLEFADS